jgi:hypothetical protein
MKDHPFFKELETINMKLDQISKLLLGSPDKIAKKEVIDNYEFIKLLNISSGTASNWRKQSKIAFKKINNKIYYSMNDVNKMLLGNYKTPKSA